MLSVLNFLWRPKSYLIAFVAVVIFAGTIGTGFAPLDDPAGDVVEGSQDAVDTVVAGVSDATTSNTTDLRQHLHEEVNNRRTERGLPSLEQSALLHNVALYHSQDMVNNSYFAHTGPNGETVKQRYSSFDVSCEGGENIWLSTDVAAANDESEMAKTIVDAWMNSPGHRENLLHPRWRTEGFGIATGVVEGEESILVTQNFC
jgi:uncharacterized protein YkwD